LAGPVDAEIWIRTTRPYVDVFVRLCRVDASGRSRNVCDGIVRIDPDAIRPAADGTRRVHVHLSPTALAFAPGERLRLQISSAAHPLFARNTGSGERLATATRLMPTEVEIFHDGDHPSAVCLPVSNI
jgi:putative CocE/NonD family hydrolase